MQSPFYKALKSINNDISPDDWSSEKRFPSWKNSLTKTSGKLTIIELPLYSSLTTSFVPVRAQETSLDRERIAGATVHKVLIIKNNETHETHVRVLTIVPSVSYMKGNGTAPLSYINLSTIFSGFIYIRDWNENLISALKYDNGKRQIFDPFEKKEKNEMTLMSSSNCDGTWDVVGYREFCITVHQADEPDPCDDPSNWGSRPIIGFTVPGDCDYGEFLDPCLGLSESDCDCLTLGVCVDDDDGETWTEEEICRETAETAVNTLANNSFTDDETIAIQNIEQTANTRIKKYEWRILKSLGWYLFSWEKGTHIKTNNSNPSQQWQWQSLEHQDIAMVGLALGGSIEYSEISAIPHVDLYTAGMDLDFKVKYSVACKGSPISLELVYNCKKIINVNE